MKSISRNILSLLLAAVLVFAALPLTAAAANNGPKPHTGQELFSSGIGFYYFNEDGVLIWEDVEDPDNPGSYYMAPKSTEIYEKGNYHEGVLPGVSYQASTNTLTLNNVSITDRYLNIYGMGDDFKLNILGDCELAFLCVSGADWGNNLTITGKGTLTVNKAKTVPYAITISNDDADIRLTAGSGVILRLYGQEGAVISKSSPNSDSDSVFTFHGAHNGQITTTRQTYQQIQYYNGYLLDMSPQPDSLGRRAYSASDPDGVYIMGDYWTTNGQGERFDGKWVEKFVYSRELQMYLYDGTFGNRGQLRYLNTEAGDYDFESSDDSGMLYNEHHRFECVNDLNVMRNASDTHRYAVGSAWSIEEQRWVYYVMDFAPVDDVQDAYVYTVLYRDKAAESFVKTEGLVNVVNGEGNVQIAMGYLVNDLLPASDWLGYRVISPDDPDGIYFMTSGTRYVNNGEGGLTEVDCNFVSRYYFNEDLSFYFEDQTFGEYGTLYIPSEEYAASGYTYLLDDQGEQITATNYGNMDRLWCRRYTDAKGNSYACYTDYDEEGEAQNVRAFTFEPLGVDLNGDEYPDVLLTPADNVDPNTLKPLWETVDTGLYTHWITPEAFLYAGSDADGEAELTVDVLDVGNTWTQ